MRRRSARIRWSFDAAPNNALQRTGAVLPLLHPAAHFVQAPAAERSPLDRNTRILPYMDLDFLQREYEAKWERRDQLQSAASTPLAVLTLLGSAILYLLQKFETDAPALLVPFWGFIAVAGGAYAVSVYMLDPAASLWPIRTPIDWMCMMHTGTIRTRSQALGRPRSVTS